MSYPKALLRLQPKHGFIADTADQEASEDFWTVCSNVLFRDGFATRLPGFRPAYENETDIIQPTDLFHAINSIFGGFNWWLIFQADGTAHAIQAGTQIQIDGGLLPLVDRPWEYSSALLNGLPIVSNSRVDPVYWDGTGDMQVLPGWRAGESCAFIAVLKFHIFAFNISGPSGNFAQLVRWSSATEPGTVPQEWIPSLENDAGDFVLADSPGAILCAYPLGDSLYVYKRNATYAIRYVGGQNVFSARKVQSNSGCLSPRSVCDIGGAHFIVSDGDIIINDGTTRRSIGESRVKEWLFNQIALDETFQVACSYNRSHDEVIISFPSTGSAHLNTGLVYDLSRDSFGVRQLNQARHLPVGLVRDAELAQTWENRTETWAVATGVWALTVGLDVVDSLVVLTADELLLQDVNVGTEIEALIGRTGLTFGEPERIKFVKRVHIRTREPFGELFVRVGASMTPNGAIDWSPIVTISGTESIVNAFAQGRFIAVQVGSNDGVIWKLTGVDIEAEMRGYH